MRQASASLTLSILLATLMACSAPAASPAPAQPPAAQAPAGNAAGAPAAQSAAPAAPAPTPIPLRKINVGMVNTGMSYIPHRVAQVQGFYREAGFDVELQVMQTTTLLAGLAAGEIGLADSGGSGIRAAATGLPVRVIGCHGVRPLYSVALAPGVQTARDLEGKGFAINTTGDDTHIVARELIRKYGGDPTRIEYLGVGASTARLAALESGHVGGGILSAAEMIRAREAGLAILNTAEDLPLACNNGSVLAISSLAERPEEARNALRAINAAVQFLHANRADSIRILADWQQMDERQAALAFDAANVHLSFSTDKAAGQQAIENALDFAKQSGQVEPNVQLRDVADLSFYP